jgi:hypothetical protein
MSDIMTEPSYARILDTRLEALSENKICYALKEGASVQSFVPLNSSSYSNQNIVWNLNNIADFTARDSRLAVSLTAVATLTFTNTSAVPYNVFQSDNFGAKQYPVNRIFSSLQHQINQASYTLQTNSIIDVITKMNLFPDDCNYYNNTQPDAIDSYAAATGTNFNPLQPYSTTLQGDGVFKPRTLGYSFTGTTVIPAAVGPVNGTGTVVITMQFYEPLISPFNNVGKQDQRALYAITGELITATIVPDIFNNMFAYVVPTASTGVTYISSATINSVNPVLNCIYLTPKEETILQIPRESVYHYNDYSIFNNDLSVAGVNAGVTVSGVNSQVVNFTNLPDKILVYVRLSDNNRSAGIPDKYLALNSIQCTFDNGLPNFAGASQNQLYDVATRNGINMPRPVWTQSLLNNNNQVAGNLYGAGSVFCISPALDLGIRPTDTSGSGGRYIFQVQNASFTNNTAINYPQCTLYVVGINSSVLQRVGSQYRNFLLTTPPDIINRVKDLPAMNYNQYIRAKFSNSFLMGGGVGDFLKRAHSLGTRAYDLALKHAPEIRQAFSGGAVALNTGDRGTRLFGSNPRPSRTRAFFQ